MGFSEVVVFLLLDKTLEVIFWVVHNLLYTAIFCVGENQRLSPDEETTNVHHPTDWKLFGFTEGNLEMRARAQFKNQLDVIVFAVCNLASSQIPEIKRYGIPSASPFDSSDWNSPSFLTNVAAFLWKERKLCWALSGVQLHSPIARGEEQK